MEIKVIKEVLPLTAEFKEHVDLEGRAIFIPGIGNNCHHYLYLVDVDTDRVILWDIDVLSVKNQLREDIDKSVVEIVPWNQESLDKYLEVLFFPHSADYHDRKVYVTFIEGNFVLELDMDSEDYEMIYEKSASDPKNKKIYSSTNAIRDGIMYFSRWNIDETFIYEANPDKKVNLEIGTFDLKTREFKLIDTIKGPDDIHSTEVTPDGKKVILIEMTQDLTVKSPIDFELEKLDSESRNRILAGGFKDSKVITYDLESRTYEEKDFIDGPAHIEFSKLNKDNYFLSSHFLNTNNDSLYCFGPSTIYKIHAPSNEIIGSYSSEDFLRAPSHNSFILDNKELLAVPVFPNKVAVLDTENMTHIETISLRKTRNNPSFENGPMKYPRVNQDRTPYTVLCENNSSMLILTSVWNITLYDFKKKEQQFVLRYNNGKPIIAMGHGSFFQTKSKIGLAATNELSAVEE